MFPDDASRLSSLSSQDDSLMADDCSRGGQRGGGELPQQASPQLPVDEEEEYAEQSVVEEEEELNPFELLQRDLLKVDAPLAESPPEPAVSSKPDVVDTPVEEAPLAEVEPPLAPPQVTPAATHTTGRKTRRRHATDNVAESTNTMRIAKENKKRKPNNQRRSSFLDKPPVTDSLQKELERTRRGRHRGFGSSTARGSTPKKTTSATAKSIVGTRPNHWRQPGGMLSRVDHSSGNRARFSNRAAQLAHAVNQSSSFGDLGKIKKSPKAAAPFTPAFLGNSQQTTVNDDTENDDELPWYLTRNAPSSKKKSPHLNTRGPLRMRLSKLRSSNLTNAQENTIATMQVTLLSQPTKIASHHVAALGKLEDDSMAWIVLSGSQTPPASFSICNPLVVPSAAGDVDKIVLCPSRLLGPRATTTINRC